MRMSSEAIKEIYTQLYRNPLVNSDSPYEAQKQMARAIVDILRASESPKKILHIGAGTGQMEKEMLASYSQNSDRELLKASLFCTLDIATINVRKLASYRRTQVHHVQADGSLLPFPDESFDIVVSNMALDFMPKEAVDELARVAKGGSNFILTLHHPIMMQQILKDISNLKTKLSNKQKVFLEDFFDNKMFRSKKDIAFTLLKRGLICKQISHRKTERALQQNDHWWFVYGYKYSSTIR